MGKTIFYLSKFIIWLQKHSAGGTSFPGKIALRYKPNLFEEFTLPEQRVFVSGTNGKTSTANFIANIFLKAGQEVCHNTKGANMLQGIATALLKESNSHYQVDVDSLVIEIDELTMPKVFKQVSPHTIIMTNLFNDQIDRYGDKRKLAVKLSKELPVDIRLFVNGDDPTLVWLANQLNPEKVFFFGLDPEFIFENNFNVEKKELCPNCGKSLNYSKRYYDSLGKFNCTCGFASPDLNFIAKNIDLEKESFTVEGQVYLMAYNQLYLVYNMLSAIAYTLEEKINKELISRVLSERIQIMGRFEYLEFNQHKAWLNLVKNPAGLNQSLSFISNELEIAKEKEYKLNVFLSFNNKAVDGVDDSWLEDVDFFILADDKISKVYIAGDLSDKIYGLLEKANIASNKIHCVTKMSESIEQMKASDLPGYFLTNVTMLASVRNNILESNKY